MIISGNGIATPIQFNVLDSFTFGIDLSYKWMRLGDGSYVGPDRGTSRDHISCKLRTHGRESYIDAIEQALSDNTSSSADLLFEDVTAPIFGHHVDYSQEVRAVFTKAKPKKQRSLHGYSLELEFDASNISFLDLNPVVLPELNFMRHTTSKSTEYDFVVNKTYSNGYGGAGFHSVHRMGRDSGRFVGEFKISYENLGKLLNFQRLNRTAPFDMPVICGIDEPFGVRGGSVDLMAKLYSIGKVRYLSPTYYAVTITFVQDF